VAGLRFIKGHGTENDFLLLPEPPPGGLTAAQVAALCDRRSGLGADGVLLVVATGGDPAYFMDYRNADGSAAELCGNGVRVFARYLLDAGLAAGTRFTVGTRAGTRTVFAGPDGDVGVDMGRPQPLPGAVVTAGGRRWPAVGVALGNPHLVARVDDPADAGPLTTPPAVEPDPPGGVNVEFVAVRGPGELALRVHERGVGETRSCGTGVCAAAAAAEAWPDAAAARYTVRAPGGALRVDFRDDGVVWLTGPAVLVAEGRVRPDWWPAGVPAPEG
jgi:diaminopimelate epimerase